MRLLGHHYRNARNFICIPNTTKKNGTYALIPNNAVTLARTMPCNAFYFFSYKAFAIYVKSKIRATSII